MGPFDLLVFSFEEENEANEALKALQQLKMEGVVGLVDAATLLDADHSALIAIVEQIWVDKVTDKLENWGIKVIHQALKEDILTHLQG